MAVASALFSCGQKQDSAASSSEATKDSLGGMMTTSDEKTKIVLSQIDAYEKGDTINFAPAIDENIRLYVPTDTAAAIKGRAEYVATMLVGQHQLYENIVHKNKRVSTVTMNNGEVWTLIWSIWTADGKFTKSISHFLSTLRFNGRGTKWLESYIFMIRMLLSKRQPLLRSKRIFVEKGLEKGALLVPPFSHFKGYFVN